MLKFVKSDKQEKKKKKTKMAAPNGSGASHSSSYMNK